MDPNTNLAEQESIYKQLALLPPPYLMQPHHRVERRIANARLRELREALRHWLSRGGFEPDWSKTPKASRYHGR